MPRKGRRLAPKPGYRAPFIRPVRFFTPSSVPDRINCFDTIRFYSFFYATYVVPAGTLSIATVKLNAATRPTVTLTKFKRFETAKLQTSTFFSSIACCLLIFDATRAWVVGMCSSRKRLQMRTYARCVKVLFGLPVFQRCWTALKSICDLSSISYDLFLLMFACD